MRDSIELKHNPKGTLIIIGGGETKNLKKDCCILKEVARRAKESKGTLLIMTVATQLPKEVAAEYTEAFQALGVSKIDVLDIRTRTDAYAEENVKKLLDVSVVFFTGGDQLRITSQIGDTMLFQHVKQLYERGGTVVGTSAGAAAMPETMLIAGPGDKSFEISGLSMASGLGLLPGVVIDSHFAQRGRLGRILGAVAQNPKNIGLGIDEDTAVVATKGEVIEVLGDGAVYIIDGTGITYSSLSEKNPEGAITICDIRLHVLGQGCIYNLKSQEPMWQTSSSEKELG